MNITFLLAASALFGVSLSAYDKNSVLLIGNLETCAERTNSDVECYDSVKDGIKKINSTIKDIKDLKRDLGRVVSGTTTLRQVIGIAKFVPGIGAAIKVLTTALKAAELPLKNAKNLVTKIDAKISPFKPRIQAALGKLEKAIDIEGRIHGNCTNGESIVSSAKSGVDRLPSGRLRSTLENGLEAFGGALNGPFSTLNRAFGNVGEVCSSVKSITDKALQWPSLSPVKLGLKRFTDKLNPIIDFFNKVKGVLSREFCIPNPLEKVKELEIVEEVAEVGRAAKERLEEAREKVFGGFIFGKRRRRSLTNAETQQLRELLKKSLSDISVSEQTANALIRTGKRGDICFSAQKILDGVDSAFNLLLAPVNAAINALLRVLPSFELPGLPNFDVLNFDIDFNLPSLDFGVDFNLYAKFDHLKFDCAAEVSQISETGRGALDVDCSLSLESFESTFGKRELEFLSERSSNRTVVEPLLDHHDRKDDKNMTMDEAMNAVDHMSSEAKKRLTARLHELGVEMDDVNELPTTTTEQPNPEESLRELVRMLADDEN